ncbi:MAG: hypothetical protein ABFE01_24400 [Phycisphaerales bacterium]
MSKRKLIFLGVILAMVAVGAYGFVHLCRTSPAFYGSVVGAYELREDQIRLAFRQTVGRELPDVVRNARGILFGGREAHIFVAFDTDAAGIARIERMYQTPHAEVDKFEGIRLSGAVAGGWTVCAAASAWEERTGRRVLDPNAVGAGRKIIYPSDGGEYWEVYIDDEHSRVYIHTGAYT